MFLRSQSLCLPDRCGVVPEVPGACLSAALLDLNFLHTKPAKRMNGIGGHNTTKVAITHARRLSRRCRARVYWAMESMPSFSWNEIVAIPSCSSASVQNGAK
jgi:hypothetical protein